jgi:hypothetical protein
VEWLRPRPFASVGQSRGVKSAKRGNAPRALSPNIQLRSRRNSGVRGVLRAEELITFGARLRGLSTFMLQPMLKADPISSSGGINEY